MTTATLQPRRYRSTKWEEEKHSRDEGGKFATQDSRGSKPAEGTADKAPAFDPAELRAHAGYDDAHNHLTANDPEYGGLMGRALERWVNEGGHIEDLEEFQQAEARLHSHLSAESGEAEPEAPKAPEETEEGSSATPLHQEDSPDSIEQIRQESLQQLEQAPRSPIKQAMGSLLGSKAVRKTGMIEESFFDPDYAKRMYSHLEASERDGDGFGEVYDLSGFLGEGALGYHSPAGLLTMVPPMHKGDDWDVRFSVAGDLGAVDEDGENAETPEEIADSEDVPEADFGEAQDGSDGLDDAEGEISGEAETVDKTVDKTVESTETAVSEDQSPDAGKMVAPESPSEQPKPGESPENAEATPGAEASPADEGEPSQSPDTTLEKTAENSNLPTEPQPNPSEPQAGTTPAGIESDVEDADRAIYHASALRQGAENLNPKSRDRQARLSVLSQHLFELSYTVKGEKSDLLHSLGQSAKSMADDKSLANFEQVETLRNAIAEAVDDIGDQALAASDEKEGKPKHRGPGYTRAGRVRTQQPTSPKLYEAITDAIGDDNPEAFNAFRQDVEEIWREQAGQHGAIAEATREITMRQGGKLGGFVNRLRSVSDAAQLKGFDEMVDYAQHHYPWMRHDPYGRGSNDEENNLLENLKRGMGPAPKKGDDAIIGQVLARWGNPGYIPAAPEEEEDFSHVTPDDLESVPFRKSAEFKRRYAKWLGKSPVRKWQAMVYARQ